MRRVGLLPVALLAVASVIAAIVIANGSASVVSSRPAPVASDPGRFGVGLSKVPSGHDYERMARGGVGTVRFVLDWRRVEPQAGGPFRWRQTDRYIAGAARRGVSTLPLLFATPPWLAHSFIRAPVFSAKARADWGRFVGAAAARYGRDGAFWRRHPSLPYDPVRYWQVWNEQNSPDFYGPDPSPSSYLRLLKISSAALRTADSRARIVLGGMFEGNVSYGAILSWRFLARLYQLGGDPYFDVVGAHPYSPHLSSSEFQVRRLRAAIVHHHDSRTPIWIDEIGWGSARGGSPLNDGPAGQATKLHRLFRFAQRSRRALRIQRVLWYPWRDSGHTPEACTFCGSTGLIRRDGAVKPAWRAFRRIAAN
jgi:hypothetical protein